MARELRGRVQRLQGKGYLAWRFVPRGDRRVGRLIHQAWKNGCRLDAWGEYFDFARWQAALSETDLDASFYVHRRRDEEEVLPWDHIDVGVSKQVLLKEKHRSEAMEE